MALALALAPGAAGITIVWWSLARADADRISTFFIGTAGIILCALSFILTVTVGVYYATS